MNLHKNSSELYEESASQQINKIIEKTNDWRRMKLASLRTIILQAHPDLIEEVKWKKPSRPEGIPVWTCKGIICMADTLKNAVRLTFPEGTQLHDTQNVFNTRLDSKTVRAIDYYEDTIINDDGLISLIVEVVEIHSNK